MSDIKHAYPLILNKVASPNYATPILRRVRLLDWLNDVANCRAVVLAADAGYGKTTLLWQWEREASFPCFWYKLDRNDRDWTFHINYLIESIAQRHKGFGRRAHSMLEQMGGGSSRGGVAGYLLAEMHERLTEPCTFIVDDWQYVNAATEVRGLWNQILRDAPATCRFVFASRVKPKLEFARFKTHGGYAELRTDAFRFNEFEIGALFRDIYGDPLEPNELTELERRTEGWAASLQLVEVALRELSSHEARREFIESITAESDSDLFDFLAEEVLDQQPEETRNFLLSTSILQQITPEVAERLAGVHDGRRELIGLEHRGLFTSRLDDVRFRYHNLFREFLERRLITDRSEAEVIALHIHAASYFDTTEQWPEAIHHYLRAGLQRQAARLIAKYGEDVAAGGGIGLVDQWLQELPPETIRQNARLSLLHGEACGIRGDWDRAIRSLERAREYFARKGDNRLEALACLKLSTVHSGLGHVNQAAVAADAGLALVPSDAAATRLRLEGNLAVSRTWLTQPLEVVVRECQRIAVESETLGLEHLAAIAHHNAGGLLLRMGRIVDAEFSLEKAARFWSDPPTSPFADNSEFVAALLLRNHVEEARTVAMASVQRTRPWSRPHAEAQYGLAAVFMAEGRLDEAIRVLDGACGDRLVLGSLDGLLRARLVEALFLAEDRGRIQRASSPIASETVDPRYRGDTAAARAIAIHAEGTCRGECQDVLDDLAEAAARGARATELIGRVQIGVLALEHGRYARVRHAWQAVADSLDAGLGASLRWWLRKYSPYASTALRSPNGAATLARLSDVDADGWRDGLVEAMPKTLGADRATLLDAIAKHANRDTVDQLRRIPGPDIAEYRRNLQRLQAPRLFLRTFGGVSLHRGSWEGPPLPIEKKRVRMLLAVLAAKSHTSLSRDVAIDILWPDADADAAVNNLNQTVFQLRRYIDPAYKGGESPEYIISTSEQVALNPALVHTDLDEVRRLATRVDGADWTRRQTTALKVIDLVRGQFLADLQYEEWAAVQQLTVQNDVRDRLLPIAIGADTGYELRVATRAATALVGLDPYDEPAVLALVDCLARSGRRRAARDLVVGFMRRIKSELEEEPSDELERVAQTFNAVSQPELDSST